MKKMSKIFCSALVLCGAFCVTPISAYATGDMLIDEPVEEEIVTTVIETEVIESAEISLIPDTQPFPNAVPPEQNVGGGNSGSVIVEESQPPVIPEGNAVVIEDVNADVVDRQFLTIQSKNGNTFYLVVDKDSKGKENVYFMNLVDEYDMLAFAEDFPEGVTVGTPDGETPTEPVTDAEGNVIEQHEESKDGEKTEQPAEGGSNMLLIVVGILALVGGGAFYYFKIYKNKPKDPKQSDYSDEEDEDYEEETVNEDTDESDEDEM